MAEELGITYSTSSSGDREQMLELAMESFVKLEPLSKAAVAQGLISTDAFEQFFKNKIASCIGTPYTVVAKHGEKVVGMRIVKRVFRDDNCLLDMKDLPQKQEIMNKLLEATSEDLPEDFLHLQISAVLPDYHNKGISGKMLDWVIAKAKEDGVPAILGRATGVHSQNILIKRGNEKFLRGRLDLVHTMVRIKVKGTGVRAKANPTHEPNFYLYPPIIVCQDGSNCKALPQTTPTSLATLPTVIQPLPVQIVEEQPQDTQVLSPPQVVSSSCLSQDMMDTTMVDTNKPIMEEFTFLPCREDSALSFDRLLEEMFGHNQELEFHDLLRRAST